MKIGGFQQASLIDYPKKISAIVWTVGCNFRCPFCYFLLKLPKSASKLMKSKEEESKKIILIENEDYKKTRMIEIHEDNINQIDESCTYCHNIFLGEYKVFQCVKCGSYYHEPCLQKMFKEIKACRFCGAEIVFES